MNLRQLRYFIAIVEQGSISKAAEHLHIAQPALSQHIRNMESDLGVKLLHRIPRGVIATEAGERLLRHARLIVDQFEHAREDLLNQSTEPSGVVRFGLPGTVSQILSVPLIETVRARHPKIQLRIAEAMSGFIHEWLRDGKIDLGVIYRSSNIQGLKTRLILSEELCLLGAPSSKINGAGKYKGDPQIDFKDAAALKLILPGPSHGLRQQLDEIASRNNVALNTDVELDAYAQIKILTERDFGFTILPRMAAKTELETGRLGAWHIRNPQITRDVYLARGVDRPMTRALTAVDDICREILRELVRSDVWTAVSADDDDAG